MRQIKRDNKINYVTWDVMIIEHTYFRGSRQLITIILPHNKSIHLSSPPSNNYNWFKKISSARQKQINAITELNRLEQ